MKKFKFKGSKLIWGGTAINFALYFASDDNYYLVDRKTGLVVGRVLLTCP